MNEAWPGLPDEQVALVWQVCWDEAKKWQARNDDQHGWEVRPGSRLGGDDRISKPFQVSHGIRSVLHAAIDHHHAICALRMEARSLHTYAGASLVRGSLEASAMSIFVLAPEARAERVLRSLRWFSTDQKDRAVLERQVGNEVDHKIQLRADLAPITEKSGISLDEAMRPVSSTAAVTAAASYARAQGGDLDPLLHWRLTSGFAHGRRWAALAFSHQEARDSTQDKDSVNIRFSMTDDRLLGLVLASSELLGMAIGLFDARTAPVVPPEARKARRGH